MVRSKPTCNFVNYYICYINPPPLFHRSYNWMSVAQPMHLIQHSSFNASGEQLHFLQASGTFSVAFSL
jgi:hypothetical protein